MKKEKCLNTIFWISLVLGVIFLCLGVLAPLFLATAFNEKLKDLWLKPDTYNDWGVIPGNKNVQLLRSYNLYNITNLNDVLNNSTPKLIQVPQATFQEYSSFQNWEYQNISGDSLGQNVPGDFIAYNYELNLKTTSNGTGILPPDTNITSINLVTYMTFYTLTHSPPPLYMIPALYDTFEALGRDFYITIITYTAYQKYLLDTSLTAAYMSSLGLNANTIIGDKYYGWNSLAKLKLWVMSLLNYNETQCSDSYELIRGRFYPSDIVQLIVPGSLLYELVETIRFDMLNRYGTDNYTELSYMQWSNGTVTNNLPLDLGELPLGSSPQIRVSSYIQINETFKLYTPEIYYLQKFLNIDPIQNYTSLAKDLLGIEYTFPRTNEKSLFNLNNLALFFTDEEAACDRFNMSNEQYTALYTYLGALILDVPDGSSNRGIEKYGLFISKLCQKLLHSEYLNLLNDAYWAVPTLLVYNQIMIEGKTFDAWMESLGITVDYTKDVYDTSFIWNIANTSDWNSFEIWVKAGFKGKKCSEYQRLASTINPSFLDMILYNGTNSFQYYADQAMRNTSIQYSCANPYCDYMELFYMQWSTSVITLKPPNSITNIVSSSNTIQSWLPSRYIVPMEWSVLSNGVPAPRLLLTYDFFLNSRMIRIYLSYYFRGPDKASAQFFISPAQASVFYNYFLSFIPGLKFFEQKSISSFLYDTDEPFTKYVRNLDIYQGGYPALNPNISIVRNIDDNGKPKHVKKSGRLDTSQSGYYEKYYGIDLVKYYTLAYDDYSANQTKYVYNNIWNGDVPVGGCDGGRFGTGISKDNDISVFVQNLLREVQLAYSYEFTYQGLNLYRYIPKPGLLNTSESVPANALYNQNPNGFDGFFNLSGQYGGPVFVSFLHCYKCSEEAQSMVEYYEYSDNSSVMQRIYPSDNDSSYTDIEPFTGTGIRAYLAFEIRVGFYNDYFFKGFKEPVPGKGVSIPVYSFIRTGGLTDSQIEENFGTFKNIKKLRHTLFILGISIGVILIVVSVFVLTILYRRKYLKRETKRRQTIVQKYLALDTKQ